MGRTGGGFHHTEVLAAVAAGMVSAWPEAGSSVRHHRSEELSERLEPAGFVVQDCSVPHTYNISCAVPIVVGMVLPLDTEYPVPHTTRHGPVAQR